MKRMTGFSLIELVIVVVLLGLLAATALPRFLNITEDAEDATVEGVAGGFATAISLARAQWEVEGRPKNDITINMDGYYFHANDLGYPSGVTEDRRPDEMTDIACKEVFDAVLQSPPTSTIGDEISEFRYYITVEDDAKGITFEIPDQPDGISKRCVYYLVATLKTADQSIPVDALAGLNTVGNGFTYDSATGQILPFSNNL